MWGTTASLQPITNGARKATRAALHGYRKVLLFPSSTGRSGQSKFDYVRFCMTTSSRVSNTVGELSQTSSPMNSRQLSSRRYSEPPTEPT